MFLKNLLASGLMLGCTVTLTQAQGFGSASGDRLINFDRSRDVCVQADTQMFDSPNGTKTLKISTASKLKANAITLDQHWISIETNQGTHLVRVEQVSFNPC